MSYFGFYLASIWVRLGLYVWVPCVGSSCVLFGLYLGFIWLRFGFYVGFYVGFYLVWIQFRFVIYLGVTLVLFGGSWVLCVFVCTF